MQLLHKKYKKNQEVVWLSKQTLSMHHASAKSFHVNDRDVADRMLESKSGTKLLHLDNCSPLVYVHLWMIWDQQLTLGLSHTEPSDP